VYREQAEERPILIVAGNAEIRAFERKSGQLVWKHEITTTILGMTARIGGAIDLQIVGGRVFVALRDSILCLDYLTGTPIGSVKLASQSARVTFVIDGDHLFVASGRTVECFTLTGERVWTSPFRDMPGNDGLALGFPGNIRQGDERGT
jgi:outer membrane protein assembly factor BamB